MMNMGGPHTTSDVNAYLRRIFLDRDIMQLPAQSLLGPFIANQRTKKVQEEYDLIGGGSPIEKWTRYQGDEMVKQLDLICPDTGKSYKSTMWFANLPFVYHTV